MFAAALLDAFPELWPDVERAVRALDLGPLADCRLVDHKDHVLTGRRFLVAAEAATGQRPDRDDHDPVHNPPQDRHAHRHVHDGHHDHGPHAHPHAPEHRPHHDHGGGAAQHPEGHETSGHKAWAAIRAALTASHLRPREKFHAVEIFTRLAEAEARVHGIGLDQVAFHEVGAIDSIVDIVVAGTIIAALEPCRWSAAPLPLGSGRVRTAHGPLPVPTPATVLLLEGLAVIDDGIAGERVTPTGAAIARHLLVDLATNATDVIDTRPLPPRAAPRRLLRSGTGFGTRRLPGLSNCLRVLAFEPLERPADPSAEAAGETSLAHRELGVISFEVDDQSAEDLSLGLDHMRAMPGIHDVIQSVAFGKKGRVATHVQVLAAPEVLQDAILACFEETTTIGLRYQMVRGAALKRSFTDVAVDGRRLRVKAVERPHGQRSGKAESDDVASLRGHARRMDLRRRAEVAALDQLATDSQTTGALS